MEIEYELTIDDILDFNIFHLNMSPSARKSGLSTRIIGALFLASLIFYMFQNENSSWCPTSPIIKFALMLLPILWFIFYRRLSVWAVKKVVVKMYKEGKNKDEIGMHKTSITPDEIKETTRHSEAKTRWSAVEKIIESDKFLVMYTGAVKAILIPKRAFPDEAKCREFIETAKKFHADAAREK